MRIFIYIVLMWPFLMQAQINASLQGYVTDESGAPVELANVAVLGSSIGTTTDENGFFKLNISAGQELVIVVSYIGYINQQIKINALPNQLITYDFTLEKSASELPGITVTDERDRSTHMTRLDPRDVILNPGLSNSVEELIVTLPGVSSTSELSSQYSVRGGSFDENLIYVNDIEVYRPFLIRAGQQEGLSFINSALVSGISFSAGGFSSEYGDRLSSVLDITYKTPTQFRGSFMMSLLGAQLHFEGSNPNNKFTYLIGGRYQTNQYLLNSLETQGEYQPTFADIQTQLTYKLHPKWNLSALIYYTRNRYRLVPEDRQTNFGTITQAFQLNVFFEGQELDDYETYMGAITLGFNPKKGMQLNLITSVFRTFETETYDILGQYFIGRLETGFGSEQFGDVVAVQGIGSYLNHARNQFRATVSNVDLKGSYEKNDHLMKWGLGYRNLNIDDQLIEWAYNDSAGYSLPNPSPQPGNPNPNNPSFLLFQSARGFHKLQLNHITAYVQDSWAFILGNNNASLTAGIRGRYWDYSDELTISPRLALSLSPDWRKEVSFRFAAGVYYQAPMYRELRNIDGSLHQGTRSPFSLQFVAGMDVNFQALNRPFIFTAEAYYKHLRGLIPYEVDNVRIRYYADQQSNGYAAGLDFKLFGEFVPGIDSWASLSIMKTEEDIIGDFFYEYNEETDDSLRIEPGFIPRPNDQRVLFSLFFQDYLPKLPSFKVNLRLVFGTGLSFGPPKSQRYQQTFRMPPYRRVDIGFSKQLIGENSRFGEKNPLRAFENMWISLEVFNLFDIRNVISYQWVTDINGTQYAVPNYLTPRLLNLKLIAEF